MATVALSGIITPSNVVTATSTTTLSNKTLVAPVLGTPASGVATNLTGLPAAGVVGTAAILAANTFTAAQKWATATAIASATTVNLDAATTGNRAHITGTVAIGAWTLTGGPFTVIFDGAVPLTYHATTNRLNSGATSYTTAAGDTADIYSDGTTVFVNITKVAGTAVVAPVVATATTSGLVPTPPNNTTTFLRGDATFAAPPVMTLGTPVATTSGTSITFTGIPAGTKQILVAFNGVSTNGTSPKIVRIGPSGGVETAGYRSSQAEFTGGTLVRNWNTDGLLFGGILATNSIEGTMTLTLENATTNTWVVHGMQLEAGQSGPYYSSGFKPLAGVLSVLSLTTVIGTEAFDAGEVNIIYS